MKKILFLSIMSACICINETDAVTYSHGTQPVTTDIQGNSVAVNVDLTKTETKEDTLIKCNNAAQIDLVIAPGIEKLSPELFEQFFGKSNVDMLKSKVRCISVPNSVREISNDCFAEWEHLSQVSFDMNSQLECIGEIAFYKTALAEISIPDSVKKIGDLCFSDCTDLTLVTFGHSSKLECIGEETFGLTALTEITIPDSVNSIGARCFYSCKNLKKVSFGTASQLASNCADAFLGTDAKVYGLSTERMDSLGIPENNRP